MGSLRNSFRSSKIKLSDEVCTFDAMDKILEPKRSYCLLSSTISSRRRHINIFTVQKTDKSSNNRFSETVLSEIHNYNHSGKSKTKSLRECGNHFSKTDVAMEIWKLQSQWKRITDESNARACRIRNQNIVFWGRSWRFLYIPIIWLLVSPG